MRIMTIVGTRPEIIRLAPTIKLLDGHVDHILVHTGQNYDYSLNEVFFKDLGVRAPDEYMNVDTSSLGKVLGSVLVKTEEVLKQHRPDALLILGDTNSAISSLIAKRMQIPVFHMEAGNRSFDENVPEEINRRLVDHVADYNLVYTEHARRNLLAEGIHPSRILLTGSPMREVLASNEAGIAGSNVLDHLDLMAGSYFLVSLHREENVDSPERLSSLLGALQELASEFNIPVLVSTHPRTRNRLEGLTDESKAGLIFHEPFGFHDYVNLQMNAKLVLSDSGTVSEESAILGFPAVTLRDAIERPEALESGTIATTGTTADAILANARYAIAMSTSAEIPVEYGVNNTSHRVVSFILSTVPEHHARTGIRVVSRTR